MNYRFGCGEDRESPRKGVECFDLSLEFSTQSDGGLVVARNDSDCRSTQIHIQNLYIFSNFPTLNLFLGLQDGASISNIRKVVGRRFKISANFVSLIPKLGNSSSFEAKITSSVTEDGPRCIVWRHQIALALCRTFVNNGVGQWHS